MRSSSSASNSGLKYCDPTVDKQYPTICFLIQVSRVQVNYSLLNPIQDQRVLPQEGYPTNKPKLLHPLRYITSVITSILTIDYNPKWQFLHLKIIKCVYKVGYV